MLVLRMLTTFPSLRIVRDYEKYIARQLQRGTSRQELNVSWLKKNELEIKRHVVELRDNIKNNWSSTGQELGKELKQLWQSRPSSPRGSIDMGFRNGLTSPTARNESNGSVFAFGGNRNRFDAPSRPDSPTVGRSEDFATGYSLGLIGGVRSWVSLFQLFVSVPQNNQQSNSILSQMMRSRTSLRDAISSPPSPTGSDEEREATGPQAQDPTKAAS